MKLFFKTSAFLVFAFSFLPAALAQVTNPPAAAPLTLPSLPDNGPSVVRVLGAFALVLGVFFGGVWLFKNWQRLALQRGHTPKLSVLETRSLGGRHSIFVIGYEAERFLIASSPAGVNLLSHLPAAAGDAGGPAAPDKTPPAPPSFAQALTQVLKGNK